MAELKGQSLGLFYIDQEAKQALSKANNDVSKAVQLILSFYLVEDLGATKQQVELALNMFNNNFNKAEEWLEANVL